MDTKLEIVGFVFRTQQRALFCNYFVLVITISKVSGDNLLPKRFYVHEEVLGGSTHSISIFFQPKRTCPFFVFPGIVFPSINF